MANIHYIGFVFSNTGFATAGRGNILALHKSGKHRIRITALDFQTYAKIAGKDNDTLKNLLTLSKAPNEIQIYHSIPDLQRRVKKDGHNIGVGTFETYDPPASWIELYNKNDALIVPSQFNYEVFKKAGIYKPIFHIPHCIDFSIYHLGILPLKKYDRFTFLFIGAWKERKGYKELIQAWIEEFKFNEKVQLVIKTPQYKEAESYLRDNCKNKDCAPILVEKETYDEEVMARFIKSANCLVAPSMGEGLFLPGIQSMAVGVPVIITNYSGCKDYANNETVFLLEPEGFVTHHCLDKLPQFLKKKWAFISIGSIRKAMREVFNNKELREKKVKSAYEFVSSRFNYETTAKKFDVMFSVMNFT
jgi:glycosyltransferase involved in cell wall biosynthesis